MAKSDSKLLRQEVNELTALLRRDESWADRRRALEGKGLSVLRVVLAGFMEDERDTEFGVIITDALLQVFEFHRKTAGPSTGFLEWREVAEVEELLNTYPAARWGIQIARELERS